MTPDPITVEPATRLSEVARLMAVKHVRRLPVTAPGSKGRTLLGIVSSHDVWQACSAGYHPLSASGWPAAEDPGVGSIMSPDVRTTSPETPIEDAARLLRKYKIGALPVVRDGVLVGIITESDLLDVLLEMTGCDEPGLRVSFELDHDEDIVRRLLGVCDRHQMRLASMLSFHHAERGDTAQARSIGVARLVGTEDASVVDDIWATCRRVRRITRNDARPGSHLVGPREQPRRPAAGLPSAPGAAASPGRARLP
ncbi:MAG: CBS domain-containing protein [Deltaproteobacteria bacterium]|nr:CBS domain-containing protein [Deltaproteobacteria bacterium]